MSATMIGQLPSSSVLDAVLAHAPGYILHIDLDGKIRTINRLPAGMVESDVIGTHWTDHIRPPHHDTAQDAIDRALASGGAVMCEVEGPGDHGATVWYTARLAPVMGNAGTLGVVLIACDTTELKQAEAQLSAAERMAALGVVLASVAHEINNPLAVVRGYLDLAKHELQRRDPRLDELAEHVADAGTGADRALQIVRDIRTLSHPEHEARGPVSVQRALDASLRIASAEIRMRAQLRLSYADVPPVHASEARLVQVFLNLIVNATQALPEGSLDRNQIRVGTTVEGDGRVVVTIADNGCGIPAELQPRLFTPFVTTKPVGVGTGLGLSICHRIVNSLGGTLSFVSEVGVGTEFRVALPAYVVPPPAS